MDMGASDRFFYYVLSGSSTLDIRVKLTFREPFDIAAMKAAADEALEYIPEFNKRIVLYNGRPEAVKGSGDVRFIPFAKDRVIDLGSDETNGLLFYFAYTERALISSVYHGLTDAKGLTEYLRTMMYLYLKKKGISLSSEEEAEAASMIRTEKGLPPDADRDDLFAPYDKHGDPSVKPSYIYEDQGVFRIPETPYDKKCGYAHMSRISLSFSDVDELRKRTETSMLPLLTDIVASAVREAFGSGDEPVVIMSAVDQRRCLGSDTLVNCSDSIFFAHSSELAERPVKDRCAELKASMKRQLAAENHIKMAGDKVMTVREFEKDPSGAAGFSRRLENMSAADNFNPMTLISTITGSLSMGAADRFLEDAEVSVAENACCSLLVSWFADKMHITAANQSDSCEFAAGIVSELEKRGVNAVIVSEEREYYDIFNYEYIENINSESEGKL